MTEGMEEGFYLHVLHCPQCDRPVQAEKKIESKTSAGAVLSGILGGLFGGISAVHFTEWFPQVPEAVRGVIGGVIVAFITMRTDKKVTSWVCPQCKMELVTLDENGNPHRHSPWDDPVE